MQPARIGRYEVKGLLGRGGMAVVFRALDPLFMRDVAVKVLPRELSREPNFRDRFEQEARIMASLEFPAVVPVYDFGYQDDQPYIVMRVMEGGSLDRWLRENRVGFAAATRIVAALAGALDRAHARGIVHRDLKPSNVLLDRYGAPHIADFGIAKLVQGTASGTTSVVGTPPYMSPEQWRGRSLDGRADVYALGVVLYELLTGTRPFNATSTPALMNQHLHQPVPQVRTANPTLPTEVQAVLERSLAKQRDHRYARAGELARAVSALATGDQRGDPRGEWTADTQPIDVVEPPAVAAPTNLDFSARGADGAPIGWFDSHGFVDGVSTDYEFTVVARPRGDGSCVRVQYPEAERWAFGSMMQRCPAAPYAGRTVRFTCQLRARAVDRWTGMWVRIDRADGRALFFDNMHDRALRGTVDWTACAIECAVPADAAWLNYGVVLGGAGTAWVAAFGITAS